jgi:hypothetical protein
VQVAFPDSPRDLIGAAAKSLGLPLNFSGRDMRAAGVAEADLLARLQALRAQVRPLPPGGRQDAPPPCIE